MKNNIFENAKFGDKFKTRDDRMAIFVKSEGTNNFHPDVEAECILEEFSYVIIDKSHPMISKGSKCFSDGTNIYDDSNEDIISRWEETVDEERLDTLANDFCGKFDFEPTQRNCTDSGWEYGHTYTQLVECYKAGYRKAKEE